MRRLDKIIAFPEETALLLRDYESRLLVDVSLNTLLCGITHNLTRKSGEKIIQPSSKDYAQFQKLISHFYLVSSREKDASVLDLKSLAVSQLSHPERS